MKLNAEYELGDVVEVRSCGGGAKLPAGLGEGFQVRVVAASGQDRVVEREGREWRLPAANLASRSPRRPTAVPPVLPVRRCGSVR